MSIYFPARHLHIKTIVEYMRNKYSESLICTFQIINVFHTNVYKEEKLSLYSLELLNRFKMFFTIRNYTVPWIYHIYYGYIGCIYLDKWTLIFLLKILDFFIEVIDIK